MEQLTFCGLSVISFNANLGWGRSPSVLTVDTIEDTAHNDLFAAPKTGSPVYFYFDKYKFFGLLQKWEKRDSTSGLNLYRFTCVDPRPILEGTELIVNNYAGSVFNIRNILNCFGHIEQGGLKFGASLANESGMPWELVAKAITELTNNPLNQWGGPLLYRGVEYGIDLSEMPITPQYYRLNASQNISLMAAIEQVCTDAACDFYIELLPANPRPKIKVKVKSRYQQAPLGTINQLVATARNSGTIVNSSSGLEATMDQPTSAFLIGGELLELYPTDAITPFFGFRTDGTPVEPFLYSPVAQSSGKMWFTCWAGEIDATPIAQCFNVPTTTYILSEIEMRFALVSETMWKAYVYEAERPKGNTIGPQGLGSVVIPNPNAAQAQQFINFAPAGATDDQQGKEDIVYNFILEKARSWFGRKFWVSLPFLMTFQDPNSLQIKDSYSVVDAAWVEEGEEPLELEYINQEQFSSADGRVGGFARYDGVDDMDLSHIGDDSVIQSSNNAMYTRINVDQTIVMTEDGPKAIVDVNSPAWVFSSDPYGDTLATAWLLNNPNIARIGNVQGGFDPIFGGAMCHPDYIPPMAFEVPLRDNLNVYGPWYWAGAPGKVLFNADSSLTPWNYGGYQYMNLAAQNMVKAQVSLLQESEVGQYEEYGSPKVNLGDVLISGGTEVTNIEVSTGINGVTTRYQFRSWTQGFGVLSRSRIDQIKRVGQITQQLRKAVRIALNRERLQQQHRETREALWLAHAPNWVRPHTPQSVFALQAYDNNGTKISTAVTTALEVIPYVGLRSPIDVNRFKNSAVSSLSAVFTPFAASSTVGGLFPYRKLPVSLDSRAITSVQLNPFKINCSMDYITSGVNPNLNGAGAFNSANIDENTVRAPALRGPITIAGYGWDLAGNFFPANYLRNISNWEVGEVDFLWDQWRKVWTSHDILTGILTSNLAPGGDATCNIYSGATLLGNITVYNWYTGPGAAASANKRVILGYDMMANRFIVLGTDC
jgi:hypothetical protein